MMCYLNLSDYLTSRTVGHGIQIVTINKTEGYPEYKLYDIIDILKLEQLSLFQCIY